MPDAWSRRYEREQVIGEGGFGRVYRGLDTVTGGPVALKVLRADSSRSMARIRREVNALRALRVPGVVRLLDEGAASDGHVLVMELVEGQPFPGPKAPLRWPEIREAAVGLLEILARVHQMGLVHRDLKPSNVLVGADGRVTLLDFGLARGAANGWTLTPAGGLVGTPRYLAPEQIMGARADARADLYAVGIMVFESLTGTLPHGDADPVSARLVRSPERLSSFTVDVPEVVDSAVARLLARRVSDRWGSAAEVLSALRETAAPDSVDELARAALSRVLAGRGAPVDPPAEGDVPRVVPGAAPFESLAAMVPANPDLTLAELAAHLSATLDDLERDGGTLVVDDLERVDPWSRDLLSRYGGSIATRPKSVEVVLGESDLRALFHGPERLFHLQTDGARELVRRTGGRPSEIEVEVAAWTRAGLVRWVGRRMVIHRAAIDTLRIGYDRLGPADVAPVPEGLSMPPALEDVLAWVALAGAHATIPLLSRAMSEPRWRVEARLLELERRGAVRAEPDALWTARARPAAFDRWPPEQRTGAHLALAAVLPEGREQMLHLLLGGAEAPRVADAALFAARTALAAGRSGEAFALLEPALGCARDQSAWTSERRLLEALVDCALTSDAPAEVARAAWELARAAPGNGEGLVGLLAGWQAYSRGQDPRPHLAGLGVLPPRLEMRRMVLATAHAVLGEADRADELIAAAANHRDAELRVAAINARGRKAYTELAFHLAAENHLEAASLSDDWTVSAKSRLNAVAALLDADEPERAYAFAAEVRAEAAAARHLVCEAGAECLLRAASYRAGHPVAPDTELITALEHLGDLRLLGYAAMTEAAVAWRAQDDALATGFAARAAEVFERTSNHAGALLVRALAVAAGAGERCEVERALGACRLPLVAAQAERLLAGTDPHGMPLRGPARPIGRRREILSLEEISG